MDHNKKAAPSTLIGVARKAANGVRTIPSVARSGPFVFTVKLRLADGMELELPSVTAGSPVDAARQAERAYIDTIRRLIRPPTMVVHGPFGPQSFPCDSVWRGRQPAHKETAALFGGR